MKKQEKNKKNKKLRSLILVLFLTVAGLGTGTYAWFTANQTVTIDKIDVNVDVSSGLQISTNASTWKTKITTDDIKNSSSTTSLAGYNSQHYSLPTTLVAVSTAKDLDTGTGNMKMFKGTVKANNTSGLYELTSAESLPASNEYIVFDVYLRTDKAETISLYPTSSVVNNNAEGVGDKGLKNAARVGFVIEGNATTESVSTDPSTINAAHGATAAYIWEPNAEDHTTKAAAVASDYGYNITSGGASKYWGLNQAFTTAQDMIKLQKYDDTVKTYLTEVGTVATNTTYSSSTSYSTLFTVSSGVTKVRIYMWIEGQDIDCENSASGSNISFNLALTTLTGSGS